jgi:hypothetical protein
VTRRDEFALVLLYILVVSAVVAFLPIHQAQTVDPATVARVERLEAEVDVLRRQLAETDLARWKIENRISAIEARVAIVDARTLTLMRVVPVQAIRDRAAQR